MSTVPARAAVVGSGPNGLAAAIRLAQEGVEVTVVEAAERPGGGCRSSELTAAGVIHDDCSGIHPMAVLSPFFSGLPLGDHGLEWAWPEVDLAHPLDDGSAGVLARDMERTAASFAQWDADAWRRTFTPLAGRIGDLFGDVATALVGRPRHPMLLARFGLDAIKPATMLVNRWGDDRARALFTGTAAHVFGRLDRPFGSSVGMMLTAAGHGSGWPVARGGSQAITDALLSLLGSWGGRVVCGREVTELAGLREITGSDPEIVLLDTDPRGARRILGDRQPSRPRRAFERFRYGPAAYKVDFAIRGDVPWTAPEARRAGTLHLGGSSEEIAAVEAMTSAGRMPKHPFVLCGQQYLADPSRSRGGVNPFYAYAHVPHGYTGDATAAVIDQIERFAPGFRDIIVATHVRGPAGLAAYNANYVGGDIAGGSNDAGQVLLRPRPAVSPYATGVDGVYLCSSSTAPGAGVHGMCGVNAAEAALARLRRGRAKK